MTEEQKKIKRYVNAIERNLKMPLKMKARINSDLGTEIHLRLEEGLYWQEYWEVCGFVFSNSRLSVSSGVQKRSYVKCTVLSLVGLVCAFVPFLFPFLENLQWIFYLGVTEITLAPGLILNLITLCCSMVFMRKNEK